MGQYWPLSINYSSLPRKEGDTLKENFEVLEVFFFIDQDWPHFFL